ncbi:Putative flippase GtrA (transmembrane translocase of bactoprenol-linked glucose) [Clostridium cavendishii DSM 21758]|uniref:Putative flippase GtrA (Transmembrane translocase of bactoprenol-linked glucose) n=1 Tax=Clostridium cavendishii DSM 21758 TaxID=1121302 RepID=A0A1M6T7C9_9CLOT|nr:GtrA family protein [Clostridium cavendishii]SHK52668.1 Putative flippase GtrA (transmembrane translocase of bactoprenol-linked glucose) [Clostridium cavendishii DSM 21758]
MNHIVDTIIEFLTYSLIGISNVLIDIFIFNLLWTISGRTQGNINYLFKLISFSVYSTTGYLLNRHFTFKSDCENRAYLKYLCILALLSFLDGTLISKLTLLNPFSIKHVYWRNITILLASASTGLLGFFINKFFIFEK